MLALYQKPQFFPTRAFSQDVVARDKREREFQKIMTEAVVPFISESLEVTHYHFCGLQLVTQTKGVNTMGGHH